MEQQIESASGRELQIPKIGIGFFLYWTTATAVFVGISNQWNWEKWTELFQTDSTSIDIATLSNYFEVASAIIEGAMIATAITMLRSHFTHSTPLASQPGHWILFVESISTSIEYIMSLVMVVSGQVVWPSELFLISAMVGLVLGYLYSKGARQEDSLRWKIWLAATACVIFLHAFMNFAVGWEMDVEFSNIYSIMATGMDVFLWLSFLAVVILVIVDLIKHANRDWVHYVGVFGYIAFVFVTQVWSVVFQSLITP